MGLSILSAPVHRLHLFSDLVKGEVFIAVCLALPVGRVHLILGNGLAGGRVWPDVLPSPVVTPVPVINSEPDESERNFPEVFAGCVVTRAGSYAGGEPDSECDRRIMCELV